MKKLILTSVLLLIAINFTFSIEQISDILIIEDDTLCLQSYPLEFLGFKGPFKYGDSYTPCSTCWRGYQATWKVIDGKLFLVAVVKIDETEERLDIERYFRENRYIPIVIDGLVFADWFTVTLEPYRKHHYNIQHIVKSLKENESVAMIKFRKGVLVADKYEDMN